jgi:hypothetical protein
LHRDESDKAMAPGSHAILMMDQRAGHTTGKLTRPPNRTSLPPRSPETHSVENMGAFLRQAYLSNRVCETSDVIPNACQ